MSSREAFYSQLHELQHAFNSMQPELEVTLRDKQVNLEAHIVVWNTAISRDGPLPNCAKGGTRIRAGLTSEEVRILARTMAIKNAAAGLPLGGCKSGINADPKSDDFEKRYRRFIHLCQPFLYENGGIFGGFGFDIGASPEHAIWACDTLQSTKSFTGKALHMGGTDYDRQGIAGLGVSEAAREILQHNNHSFEAISYAVHGIGAMGAAVIRYFHQHGAQLVAIGDPIFDGTWHFPHGISTQLYDAISEHNSLLSQVLIRKEGKHVSKDANHVLLAKCEVLFPCAIEKVIDTKVATSMHARYIIEGANNPTHQDAHDIIKQRNIQLVPDFIANAGGVISAFIEMTSDISDEDNALTRAKSLQAKAVTREKIKNNLRHLIKVSSQYQVPIRDAALHFALEEIMRSEK